MGMGVKTDLRRINISIAPLAVVGNDQLIEGVNLLKVGGNWFNTFASISRKWANRTSQGLSKFIDGVDVWQECLEF